MYYSIFYKVWVHITYVIRSLLFSLTSCIGELEEGEIGGQSAIRPTVSVFPAQPINLCACASATQQAAFLDNDRFGYANTDFFLGGYCSFPVIRFDILPQFSPEASLSGAGAGLL